MVDIRARVHYWLDREFADPDCVDMRCVDDLQSAFPYLRRAQLEEFVKEYTNAPTK